MPEPRDLRRSLNSRSLDASAAFEPLLAAAHDAPFLSTRVEAHQLLGELAGRAFEAPWELAERAAFALLDLVRRVEGRAERRALLLAMGRGHRNLWLMPFVHARLDDDDPDLVEGAIVAAGGLGFPALEQALASRFLGDGVAPALRRTAVGALGHLGAWSAAGQLASLVAGEEADAAAALAALTEIRSPAAIESTLGLLEREPVRAVRIAAIRYLAEVGREEVLPFLRRMAREADPELRLVASFASRALKAERSKDAGDRLLVALTEKDRAVRGALARRLRTLPVDEVIAQARMLLSDDAEGVVQVIGEVRSPLVTRLLLELAQDPGLPLPVRARALGAIEADEPWEREALVKIVTDPAQGESLRAAAAQAIGAFASVDEIFRSVGSLAQESSALLRGALVWAVQLAARPGALTPSEKTACERALLKALTDADPFVRRRAAYVTGNLRLAALSPLLVQLVKTEVTRPDLRIAGLTGLGELGAAGTLDAVVALIGGEEDPRVLTAASISLATLCDAHPRARPDLTPLHDKIVWLLRGDDRVLREAMVRLAGLSAGALPASRLVEFAKDPGARVREAALVSLGRLRAEEGLEVLLAALHDADAGLRERAAESLLRLGGRRALEGLLEHVSGEGDGAARARLASQLRLTADDAAHFLPLLDAALARVGPDDPAYEPFLGLKLSLLAPKAARPAGATVESEILAIFPAYARLAKVPGFAPLDKSLRTAESLHQSTAGLADADQAPPILLWMKVLEGYVHAWLSPKLAGLQRDPASFADLLDRVQVGWPSYQDWLGSRWNERVSMGEARVEVPLRGALNSLRTFQERGPRRLDSPLSITEWGRLLLFFAVDQPPLARNVFHLPIKSADAMARLSHKLQTLAAVRNLVTHRASANASTVVAFRREYYAAFEEVTRLT